MRWRRLDSLSVAATVIEYFRLFGERDSEVPKLIYSLDKVFALILELILLLSATATLETIFLEPASLARGQLMLTH